MGTDEQALFAAVDVIQKVSAMILGYRAQLIQGGIAEDVADRMTEELHRVSLSMIPRAEKKTGLRRR